MGICESKQEDKAQNKQNIQNIRSMQNDQNNQIMQNNQNKESEMGLGRNIAVPVKVINKTMRSICKITIKRNVNSIYGTGFFMKVSDTEKYLITNYHVINQNNIYDNIEIEIDNQKTMKLNLNNRKIEYFPKPIDITMIEINTNDEIYTIL